MRKLSKLKTIASIVLTLCISANFYVPTFADERIHSENYSFDRDQVSIEVKELVGKLISFYGNEYRPDVFKHLEELKEVSQENYEIWNAVMEYWDWIEMEMIENIGVAPDGIQNPAKHAFIVLGFALNSDGTMTDELIGRLEVTKASAEKYPESYILVTGGVEKNGWTEGRRMRDWLVENGIDESRIIVEEQAPDTAGNATNSFDMLYKDYDVDTVSLITSQYHLKRGSILYYAESLLKAKELGVEPIEFIGEANAGWYRADKVSESLSLKANSLRSIGRVPNVNISGLNTVMEGIEVSGRTEYTQGEELEFKVTSIDSKNYNVDLTKYAVVKDFDSNKIGQQAVTISYIQGNKVYEAKFEINISETSEELINREMLGKLIEANEARDLENYTRSSREYFIKVLAESKDIYENENSSEQEIIDAYKKLNSAVSKLVELINIAKNKEVFANYNQKDAFKITDDILSTSNYWASMDGSSNAPIDKSHFIIDLNGNYNIDTIKVFPYWGGSRYYQYDVYISEDNENWTKVAEHRSEEFCTNQGNTHKLENVMNASYVKVQGVKTYVTGRPDINNFHVIETQVFGEEVDTELIQALEQLQAKIQEADMLDQNEYTAISWSTFAEALENAKLVVSGNPTLQEVKEALEALNTSMEALIKRANLDMLQTIVKYAEELIAEGALEGVVPAVVKEFNEAYESAKEVLLNTDATQQQVDDAFDRLKNVIEMLEFKTGDKKHLISLVEKIEKLNSEEYIQDTWNKLAVELANAKAVIADENAMEEEVSTTYKKLLTAYLELRLKPSKDKLQDLINKVEGLDSDKYTEESWSNLNDKLEIARAVMSNEDATEQEINEATKQLELALGSLVEAEKDDDNDSSDNNNGNGGSGNESGNDSDKLPETGGTSAVAVGLIGLLTIAGGTILRKRK